MAITKWLAVVAAGVSEWCLVYAEAKYCAFEMRGEPKYYVCQKNEHCCNFGCCVSPGFQMYHLWYYWLLVIIMFLVCSGGGWWYRYWLHGRFRTTASTIPNRTLSTRTQSTTRDSTCRAQQARISYNTARNTVLLHRMWKAHRSASLSHTYGLAGGPAASSNQNSHYQTSVVLNDLSCPYYQLYGPPPSYETVIAQSRGKLSTPSSPELLQSGQSTLTEAVGVSNDVVAPVGPPPPAFINPHCYYNVRSIIPLEAPQYQPPMSTCVPPPRLVEGFDTTEYMRLMQQQYAGMIAGTTIVTSPRHQAHFVNESVKSSDSETLINCSQGDSPEAGGFGLGRIDCSEPSCQGLNRTLPCYSLLGKSTCKVAVHATPKRTEPKFDSPSSSSQLELTTEPSTSSLVTDTRKQQKQRQRQEFRRNYGGSLKIPKKRELIRHQQEWATIRANRRLSSTSDYQQQIVPPPTTMTTIGNDNLKLDCPDDRNSQSIPSISSHSSNVIVASTSNDNQVFDMSSSSSSSLYQSEQQQLQPCPTVTRSMVEPCSTNFNVESKRKKLDRSKSLE